jgi:YegS/Rv2252/BmrU family lipid kinase
MLINTKQYTWQIIHNPNAFLRRSSQFWKDIENKLQDIQIDYCYHETFTIDEAKELIINLCKKGERHFIVVGGDGTLNIFANAVMSSQVKTSDIYAAFIPVGTGNDWSRSHGYSNGYLDAINTLIIGHFIAHDIGLVETIDHDEGLVGTTVHEKVVDARYFVNIAGFGFDGAVIANASKNTTKVFHKQLYLINLLKTMLDYKSQPVHIKSNNATIVNNIFTIAVGICQFNGNGMRQCPEAIPNDGLFDVVVIKKVSVPRVLLNIKNLFKGAHVKKMKEVSMIRTDYLEISTNPPILGEVEGETLTTGNYRLRCLPAAINFMVNAKTV